MRSSCRLELGKRNGEKGVAPCQGKSTGLKFRSKAIWYCNTIFNGDFKRIIPTSNVIIWNVWAPSSEWLNGFNIISKLPLVCIIDNIAEERNGGMMTKRKHHRSLTQNPLSSYSFHNPVLKYIYPFEKTEWRSGVGLWLVGFKILELFKKDNIDRMEDWMEKVKRHESVTTKKGVTDDRRGITKFKSISLKRYITSPLFA